MASTIFSLFRGILKLFLYLYVLEDVPFAVAVADKGATFSMWRIHCASWMGFPNRLFFRCGGICYPKLTALQVLSRRSLKNYITNINQLDALPPT